MHTTCIQSPIYAPDGHRYPTQWEIDHPDCNGLGIDGDDENDVTLTVSELPDHVVDKNADADKKQDGLGIDDNGDDDDENDVTLTVSDHPDRVVDNDTDADKKDDGLEVGIDGDSDDD
jgi:hypothetical protein